MALSDSLAHFSTVVWGALRLQAEAFREVHHAGPTGAVGLWIALLAGLSQAIGQACILFVNRVRPRVLPSASWWRPCCFCWGFWPGP